MHIRTDRKALLSRVSRLAGQVQAIRDAVEGGSAEDCYATLQLMTSARGALDALIRLFLEGHVRDHVAGPASARERARGAEELVQTLRSFLK